MRGPYLYVWVILYQIIVIVLSICLFSPGLFMSIRFTSSIRQAGLLLCGYKIFDISISLDIDIDIDIYIYHICSVLYILHEICCPVLPLQLRTRLSLLMPQKNRRGYFIAWANLHRSCWSLHVHFHKLYF